MTKDKCHIRWEDWEWKNLLTQLPRRKKLPRVVFLTHRHTLVILGGAPGQGLDEGSKPTTVVDPLYNWGGQEETLLSQGLVCRNLEITPLPYSWVCWNPEKEGDCQVRRPSSSLCSYRHSLLLIGWAETEVAAPSHCCCDLGIQKVIPFYLFEPKTNPRGYPIFCDWYATSLNSQGHYLIYSSKLTLK